MQESTAWFLTDTSTNTISGTSMATPHTVGVAALYLQQSPSATPAQVASGIASLTTKGIVTGAQSAHPDLLFTNSSEAAPGAGRGPLYNPPTVPEEITCLLVDDHEVVREGLRLSLSRAPHIRVVGEAGDGETAVALAERRRPDVVIMDVRMPGMDGLEATKLLLERVPDAKVLIFTAYNEKSLLSRGLESGAKGYILKEAPHQTLLRAIEKVAAGEGYVDPALMPDFLSKDRDDMLTTREREILQLLADGMSNADVAQRLFISQETVKSHVRHILAKLEADTRTHAVAIALREAIID